MAGSKTKVCCALTLLIIIIVCLAVFVRRKSPCDCFPHAAVAADSARCSQIGRDILQKGGSAVDGAIAALLCTSLVNAQSMGLGGGAIFTVMDSSGQVKIINSRETVPHSFRTDLLDSCPTSQTSNDAAGTQWIAVPGELRGYEEAHRRYGKLPWASLFEPTIKLAREGFPIPPVLGAYLKNKLTNDSSALWKLFSDKNGNPLQTGDIVKYEKLADTLETIAKDGAEAFYSGRIAEDLIRDVQEEGGTLTMQDLKAYQVQVSDPWVISLGEYQMYFPPPPSGGAVLSFVLNVMQGYNLTAESVLGEQKTLTYHRYVEALKFVSGLKKHIRDPKFGSEETAQKITEESFAKHIRSLITFKTHDLQYYNITPYLDSTGTTHMSILAEDGSAVSVTSSINKIFGSKIYSASTGVILNNQLADFCGRVSRAFPGEQPPSSMAPTVLKSQTKTLVIGASGGNMITTGIASTLMNHLWFGKSLKEGVAAPVVFVDDTNGLKFEDNFDKDVIKNLTALGHENKTASRFYNVVNAVEKVDGCICAVSDARKLGEAAGY